MLPFEAGKSLSELSTFGIGGPARFFTTVQSVEELSSALRECHKQNLPFFVLGKGSNSLFDDKGFDGLVILNKINFCKWGEFFVDVGAGYSFSLLGTQTARKGWAGLEFASGIPGYVGGAVFMNAGANGTETCETLQEVTYVDEEGNIEILPKSTLSFSYRFSSFQKRKGAVASAKFALFSSEEARQKQLMIIDYRKKTQPYSDMSAGCVFRNPSSHSAGALIEKSGLKGFKMGGAEVSTLHANFIVNKGGATAKEVLELATHVKEVVKEKTGIELEMEVRYVPSSLPC